VASGTATPIFLSDYIAVNPGQTQPGAIIVDVHDDYQCPWCARAEQIYGDALGELSQSGQIDLRIHLRTMVGDQIIHNDSSERAAIAAACANKVGYFWAYHTTIFANQPSEGVGYTDDQLKTTFAAAAGISGQNLTDFQSCYDSRATADQVTAMEQQASAAGVNGTPAFFVNGVQVNFDLQSSATTVQSMSEADRLTALQRVAG
jgi:protein-disulfide isomerase